MATDFSEPGVKTVVVVGAGAAGLQAANILLESDEFLKGRMKINVLEARDRIGGRILIDKIWNIPFDSGILEFDSYSNFRSELDSWNIVQPSHAISEDLRLSTHIARRGESNDIYLIRQSLTY
jgi:flavin-dependent dehydrogenase